MLISIEGCVGAGKTTIAKGLAAVRNSRHVLEEFALNPFLDAFYRDPTGTATETEFAFLLLHYHQLKCERAPASHSEIIADFHLGKDLIYADLNLKDRRILGLFRDLYGMCLPEVPEPALLICLTASTELILKRIRARHREYELEIDSAYFETLNEAYEQFFEMYKGKKIRVAMDEWDFMHEPSLFTKLSYLVDRELDPK